MVQILSFLFIVQSAFSLNYYDYNQMAEISESTDKSSLTVNPNAKQCGGPGKFVSLRNSWCADAACTHPNSNYGNLTTELRFVPSRQIEKSAYRLTITPKGIISFVTIDVVLDDLGKLEKDKAYMIEMHTRPVQGLKDYIDLVYQVYDDVSKEIEVAVCLRVEFL